MSDWVPGPAPTHTVTRHPDDGWRLAEPYRLTRRGERAFRGLIHTFCPPPPAPELTRDLEDRVARQSLQLLRYMHPVTRLGMRLALTVVNWSPRWRFRSWHRLHKLPRERAEALLDRLGHSRIPFLRTLVFVVRGLILHVYFDQPDVQAALGYDGVGFINSRIALRRRLLDGEAAGDADAIGPFSEAAR